MNKAKRCIILPQSTEVHFELYETTGELEVYVGGWFLTSMHIKDLSPEAYYEVFGVFNPPSDEVTS